MTYEELEADARNDRYYEWLEEQPKCRTCGTVVKEDAGIYDEDRDEYFCNQKCVDNYESDRAEAAYWRGSRARGQSQQRRQLEARMSREAMIDKLLTIEEVSAIIRPGSSARSIYAAAGTRTLPRVKIGHTLRWREQDVRDWINRHVERPFDPRKAFKRSA